MVYSIKQQIQQHFIIHKKEGFTETGIFAAYNAWVTAHLLDCILHGKPISHDIIADRNNKIKAFRIKMKKNGVAFQQLRSLRAAWGEDAHLVLEVIDSLPRDNYVYDVEEHIDRTYVKGGVARFTI